MRVKVAHIVTRLDFGGAQQNTLYTAEHLDPKRFEVWLVFGEGGRLDPRAEALEAKGVRLVRVEDLVREVSPLRDLAAFLRLYRVLRSIGPAVVHTHSSKAGILGRLAAALAGVPTIIHTFHGFGFHDRMAAAVKTAYVAAERAAACVSRRLVFVSRANMDYARAHGIGDPEAYRLIRSGVPLAAYPAQADRAAVRREFGLPPDAPLILTIGNLKPQKNCLDVVEVARAVLRERPDTRFLYVGDGPLKARFLSAAREAGAGEAVILAGWREDAARLLAAADVFLLTSLWEGLPRALVEAMKSGLPCVAYGVDGVLDLIEDGRNGCSVAPGDAPKAAEKVSALLADPDLRSRLGRAAAASIGDEFDIDRMVRAQEALYSEPA